jgi:hypothetical protein
MSEATAPPAAPDDDGPPLWLVVLPAATMVVGPLFTFVGWDLGTVLAGVVGAATAGWCFYRRAWVTLPLLGWNVALVVWAGYDYL